MNDSRPCPSGPTEIRARGRPARPMDSPDAGADLADARRSMRRVGLPQMRELPEGWRLQDPGGDERPAQARRGREGPGGHHPLLGQPRPGAGAGRPMARACPSPSSCPGPPPRSSGPPPKATGPPSSPASRPSSLARVDRRRSLIEQSGFHLDPPVRRLGRDRGPGHRRLGAARPGRPARSWSSARSAAVVSSPGPPSPSRADPLSTRVIGAEPKEADDALRSGPCSPLGACGPPSASLRRDPPPRPVTATETVRRAVQDHHRTLARRRSNPTSRGGVGIIREGRCLMSTRSSPEKGRRTETPASRDPRFRDAIRLGLVGICSSR